MAELTAKTFDNLKKSVDVLADNLVKNTKALLNPPKLKLVGGTSSGLQTEQANEDRKLFQKMVEYLKGIYDASLEDNLAAKGKEFDFSPGKIAIAFAAALGTLVGVILTQIKSIMYGTKLLVFVTKNLASIANILTRNKIPEAFAKFSNWAKSFFGPYAKRLGGFFDNAGKSIVKTFQTKMTNIVTTVVTIFENGLAKVKSFFSGTRLEKAFVSIVNFIKGIPKLPVVTELSAAITKFGQGFQAFKKPFVDVAKGVIKIFTPVLQGIKTVGNFFVGIGKFIGKFGMIAGGVGVILSKILFPLQILYGAFVAIKEFITSLVEGESFISALTNAVTELFSAFITAPLDLLKSMVSWLLGKLGFEQAEKFLDSFSFDDMFRSLIQKIKDAVAGIFGWIGEKLGLTSDQEKASTTIEAPTPEVAEVAKGVGTGKMGFADGGPVIGNKPILVGEEGPEIFVPGNSGNIIPNNIIPSSSMMGDMVDFASGQMDMLKSKLSSTNNIVSAPVNTTNLNSSSTHMHGPSPSPRNYDYTLNRYNRATAI